MRGEDGVLVRGRFTPIRSGHLPPQRQAQGLYGTPRTGSERAQRMMSGALTDDQPQPTRVVRLENRDGSANRDLGSHNGQAEQGTLPKKKKTEREERMEKCLKNAYWFIFCCGICEEWDLAANGQRHGAQNTGLTDAQLMSCE